MNPRVVVIGDALIDEFRTPAGSEDFVGGAGLNVAIGLSILGQDTALVAMVGDDRDGDAVRAFLDEHGVVLLPSAGVLGTSRAISDRTDGEPRYEFNQAAKHRRLDFGREQREALDAAELVVVSCFPFDNTEQSDALAAAVRDPESRLVIDPNPRAGMLSDGAAFVTNFEALAARSLIVKIGDDDAQLLYGQSLDEVAERLVRLGAPRVLVTAGRGGAGIHMAAAIGVDVPIAAYDGPVVDTMGAGDATLASSVSSVLRGGVPTNDEAWLELLERAMLVAAATCRSKGALLQKP